MASDVCACVRKGVGKRWTNEYGNIAKVDRMSEERKKKTTTERKKSAHKYILFLLSLCDPVTSAEPHIRSGRTRTLFSRIRPSTYTTHLLESTTKR